MVYSAIVSVLYEVCPWTGQLVTVGAQSVTVCTFVVYTIDVVTAGADEEGATVELEAPVELGRVDAVLDTVGLPDLDSVGFPVSEAVGLALLDSVGLPVGFSDLDSVGLTDLDSVGLALLDSVGLPVGFSDLDSVGFTDDFGGGGLLDLGGGGGVLLGGGGGGVLLGGGGGGDTSCKTCVWHVS